MVYLVSDKRELNRLFFTVALSRLLLHLRIKNMNKPNKSEQIIIRLNCEYKFTQREIRLIRDFFGCQTSEELVQAAYRYSEIMSSGVDLAEESFDQAMKLSLSLANEVYANLRNINEPLRKRYGSPTRGRPWLITLPPDISQRMQALTLSGYTRLAAVMELQKNKILDKQVKPSSLLKRIQQLESRHKRAIEDFKDVDVSKYL